MDEVVMRRMVPESLRRGETPRVTVVVPAHNAGQFVRATLESISAQTLTEWQAVVIDDCSTDETVEVVREFTQADPRFHLIKLQRNSGPAAARNAGIAGVAATELIALLDADDLWRPDYLAKQVARYESAVAQGRKVGIVACNAQMLTADGVDEHTWFDLTGWVEPIGYEAMLERSYIFVSAIFPRAAWEEVGGFAVECWGSEDYDLWLQILELGYQVVASPEPLVIYRVHKGSLTGSRLRVADAHIAAYERALRRRPEARYQRTIKRELRHYRALRGQAVAVEALRSKRLFAGAALALGALPATVVAVLQRPRRWTEWLGRLVGRPRKPRSALRPRSGPG